MLCIIYRQEENQQATGSGTYSTPKEIQSSSDEDEPAECELPPLVIEPTTTKSEGLSIKGRRIVDMEHILNQFEIMANHPKHCTMGKYKYLKENRNGLFCEWIYYCDNCEKEFVVTSEPIDSKQEINDAVVWGSLSVGIGYNQVEELFSVMNVPIMCQDKFQKHEKKVGKVGFSILYLYNYSILFVAVHFLKH